MLLFLPLFTSEIFSFNSFGKHGIPTIVQWDKSSHTNNLIKVNAISSSSLSLYNITDYFFFIFDKKNHKLLYFCWFLFTNQPFVMSCFIVKICFININLKKLSHQCDFFSSSLNFILISGIISWKKYVQFYAQKKVSSPKKVCLSFLTKKSPTLFG